MNYFEVKIDGRSLGYYNKDARSKFIRDRKLFHELEITEYNKSHLQVGLEQYLDGKLIYKYKEKLVMKILDTYSEVVWEQRRYEIAKDAMVGIIANSHDDEYRVVERGCSQNYKFKLERAEIVHRAVLYADALIAELKKKGE